MEFIQQLINGISLGSIYALIALGYTMVYGIIRLINFAHGDIYMIGAYAGFFATTVFKLGFVPALLFAMLVAALFGIIIERAAYKPLRNMPKIAALITAIGVSLFLENLGIYVLGAQPRTFPDVFPLEQWHVFGVVVTNRQVVILGVALLLMLVLQYIIHYTKIGKAMRASSFDLDAARLMGINVDTIISCTFAIGSALAGAAGVLVGVYYNSIEPLMGMLAGIKAFVAAVLGGIGSIPGAMLGGLILGMAEVCVVAVFSSTYRDAIAFTLLIIILLVRPTGLLGKSMSEKV